MTGNMTGCTSSIGECCHQEKCATMCKTKKRTPGQGIITVQSGALQSGAPVKPSTRDEEGVTGDKKGPFEIVFSVSQQPGQSVKTVRIKQFPPAAIANGATTAGVREHDLIEHDLPEHDLPEHNLIL
ncbi:hypothetical protein GNI_084390 [Gregarina niphandrodes]|uniref:Uncharacterized protein n=1 Tax=Gregarina niphandrodes TaxID=110365 RepID=A0A023B635_GRENI|nr:hypothetical protein GNI_084390 [Gregarina niphandrodes]EZG65031.1 hypothetical protein GNI_084390 [Gregarina niphandrodes]|eukprot:XP_011134107.1 hypothetical protein GNI_084390 [Gregarina niphandrodes]